MCIGLISALSVIGAMVMFVTYPLFPIDELLPPPEVHQGLPRFSDQQWQEDWNQRWEPNLPE